MIVDLGCGGNKRGDIGIDMVRMPGVDYVVFLGIEPIPLGDESVNKVIAYDILEHIPNSIYYYGNRTTPYIIRPRIQLLREVYRILKPGGIFETFTPLYPSVTWCQDPTHEAPPWVRETWNYFTGDLPEWMAKAYGIDFAFKVIREGVNTHPEDGGQHLFIELMK